MAGEQFFFFLLLIAAAWSIAFFLWVLVALWRESRKADTRQTVCSQLQSARRRIETGWTQPLGELRSHIHPSPQ
jgi:hypothetical protein